MVYATTIAALILAGCAVPGGTTNFAGVVVIEDEPGSSPTCSAAVSAGELCVEGQVEAVGGLEVDGATTMAGLTTIGSPTCATATAAGELCVEGDIEVEGNVVIEGTLTVTSSQTIYGEAWVAGNSNATTINTVNVWEEINDDLAAGRTNGMSVSGSDITVGAGNGGDYICQWTAATMAALANKTFEIAFSVDDAIQTKCQTSRRYSATDVGASAGQCVLNLAAAEVVKLEARNITDNTNITFQDVNINCEKI